MNASSQHGPTIGKAILQQHKTNDIFNSLSSSSGSTPPLTQSTISTSRSPPQPSTPPSRYTRLSVSRTRYPADLTRARDGRLPLHRRGTSQTYEPFEDLLREAGYKETRIFTPEIERVAEEISNGKGKVAGMVNFLSGFIPGSRSSSMKESSPRSSLSPASPSPSPLSRRRQREERQLDDDATPRPSHMRPAGPSPTSPSSSSPPIIKYTHKNASYTSIGPSISSKQMPPPSLPLPASSPNHNMHHDPRPSRATAYLRHIASVPDIPDADVQRSRSAASRSRRHRKSRNDDTRSRYSDDDEDDDFNSVYEGRTRGNGEGEEDTNVPPLPKTWLETVARAVLFGSGVSSAASLRSSDPAGGSRAVSQPHNRLSERQASPALRQLRQTRSVISRTGSLADAHHRQYHHHNLTRTQSARSVLSARSGRSDRANRSYWNWATATPSPLSGGRAAANNEFLNRPRPTLMSRLDGSSRSRASESELRTARVMCRSAPASRAASPSPHSATYSTRSGSISRAKRREQASKTDGKGKGKNQTSSKSDSRGKPKLGSRDDEPPSLTRTMVIESDSSEEFGRDSMDSLVMSANTHLNMSETGSAENRYISGWGWDSNLPSTSASALPPTQESPEEYHSDRRNQDGYFPNPYSLSVSITSTSDEGELEAVESRSGSEEEDSSENEVNLAKMLQPRPALQRQGSAKSTHSVSSLRSIRSLRKLLSSSNGAGTDDSMSIPPVPPLPAGYARNTGVDYLTPPPTSDSTSADLAGWPLDGDSQGSNGKYGTKSLRGKRASLPSGWTGTVGE